MKFSQSLRFRIQLWHGLLLAATLTSLSLAAYRYQSADTMRRVDDELREYGRFLRNRIAPPPRRQDDSPPNPGMPGDFRLPGLHGAMLDGGVGSGIYYAVWRSDGSLLAHSTNMPADLEKPRPEFGERHPRGPERGGRRGDPFGTERTRGNLREVYQFTPGGDCLLVGRSIERDTAALMRYADWLIAISASVLALGLAVGWWITTSAIRPIGLIVSTAKRIASGELGERILVTQKNSELGHLSLVLNETFAQLEESFLRQSQFTADAAHELRTPVTVILTQAQHALTRDRDPATYKQTLEVCISAARRLRQLTESLLELTKVGGIPLQQEDSDLADLTRDVIDLLQILADERGVTLVGVLDSAPCRVVPDQISQIVMNLLTNALEHTPSSGSITLRTGIDSNHTFFSITDTGPGIASSHLPRIFDRFYRIDDSRNRRTGGAGLGLAICKAIADAHGATLEVTSHEGEGCTFTLLI